jgi:hypothetical protein
MTEINIHFEKIKIGFLHYLFTLKKPIKNEDAIKECVKQYHLEENIIKNVFNDLIFHKLIKVSKSNKISLAKNGINYVKWLNMEAICVHYRGAFIHTMTLLESLIDDIIAFYFCPKSEIKRKHLKSVFLSTERVTLFVKYQLVSFIFQNNFQEFNIKYNFKSKGGKQKHPPSLDKRVNDIIEIRNKLAHRTFKIDKKTIRDFDGETVFLDAEVGKEGKIIKADLSIKINNQTNNESAKEVGEISNILIELLNLIKKMKDSKQSVQPSTE